MSNSSGSIAVEAFWNHILNFTSIPTDVDNNYPTQPAMTLLSAFLHTGNVEFKTAAMKQLTKAREMENQDSHLLETFVNGIKRAGRVENSRQIYNFAIASVQLREPILLSWAEESAKSMMSLNMNTRAFHHCLDQLISGTQTATTRQVFWDFYKTNDSGNPATYVPGVDSTDTVDGNQNAGLGLGFAILYHLTKNIAYFEFAYNELLASISVMPLFWDPANLLYTDADMNDGHHGPMRDNLYNARPDLNPNPPDPLPDAALAGVMPTRDRSDDVNKIKDIMYDCVTSFH